VAFLGVCWYNYVKIQAAKSQVRPEPSKGSESKPLLSDSK
jgi:hypothetical protein